jgi:hypothetical protein
MVRRLIYRRRARPVGARQADIFAQKMDEQLARLDVLFVQPPVDGYTYRLFHDE